MVKCNNLITNTSQVLANFKDRKVVQKFNLIYKKNVTVLRYFILSYWNLFQPNDSNRTTE